MLFRIQPHLNDFFIRLPTDRLIKIGLIGVYVIHHDFSEGLMVEETKSN